MLPEPRPDGICPVPVPGTNNWTKARFAVLPCFAVLILGNLKGKAQEFDGAVHVRRLPQINANPATVGKDVGGSATSCNHLITDFLPEGEVHQAIAVHVADFSPP